VIDCWTCPTHEQMSKNSKQQATISQWLPKSTTERTYGTMMDSKTTPTRLGSSASTAASLSVDRNPNDGLTLRRSHSCAEMRRKMVLSEWEVQVTTTNTEVTVIETQRPKDDGTLSENESVKYNLQSNDTQSGVLKETQIAEQNNSRNQTLGLAKSSVGHRRSKSSDGRLDAMRCDATADTDDIRAIATTHQNSGPVEGALAVSDTRSAPLLLETSLGPSTTQLEVPVIGTYKLSEPGVVDRFTSADRNWSERWATGSNVLDYTMVNVVEKIRLRTIVNDPNDSDHVIDEDQSKEIVFETTLVTDCSKALSSGEDNGGEQCEQFNVQSIHEAHQFDCHPRSCEDEEPDKQPGTCRSEFPDEDVQHHSDERQEGSTQTTAEETRAAETSNDTAALVNQPPNSADIIPESRAKEDEDSEEKEKDEAEHRETESEETEEKGARELNYRTVEKNASYEQSANAATSQHVELSICENAAESHAEVTNAAEHSNDHSEQRETTKETEQDVVRNHVSDVVGSDDVAGFNASAVSQLQSEARPETVQTQHNQSDPFYSSNVQHLPFSESHLPDTEPRRRSSEHRESRNTQSGRDAKFFYAAESRQVLVENARDEEQVLSVEGRLDEYQISKVDETVGVNTVPPWTAWSHEQSNINAESRPPTATNSHTNCAESSSPETSLATRINDADDFEKGNACVSARVDSTYAESSAEIAYTQSSTFTQKVTDKCIDNGAFNDGCMYCLVQIAIKCSSKFNRGILKLFSSIINFCPSRHGLRR